jgi:hypothetical protein
MAECVVHPAIETLHCAKSHPFKGTCILFFITLTLKVSFRFSIRGGFHILDAQNGVRMAHHNRISVIRKFISENWDHPKNRFEAYAYLFDHLLDDLRRDFLTDVTYYKNGLGKLTPVENDLDVIKSVAMSCGLKKDDVHSHLMRHLSLLPLRWLIDIPAWDMVDRVKTLCMGTKLKPEPGLSSEAFYEHILAWGAGLFARAANPYHQNQVVILRGSQGIGKDFFVKTLLKALGPYFGTWTNSRDEREIIMLMERTLAMNIPEFDNTHQNEIAMLKALITKYQATFRSPYARKAQSVELKTSFISSANVEYLLRDATGNRRYWIFWVEEFSLIDKFDEFDSLQILAQFKWAFEMKFKVSLRHRAAMDAYIESQTPPSLEEQIMDFWNDEITGYFKLRGAMIGGGEWLSAKEAGSILEKVRREFNIGRNHLTILLNNRECRKRRAAGYFFRATPAPLSVVKTE